MKKIFRIIGFTTIVFIIGGLGGLMFDYVVFTKVITHPLWSQNKIIKAIDNRVNVVKTVEKIIVADNESIADIASRAASSVVYIESVNTEGVHIIGNGVVISSDGVIATTKDIVGTPDVKVYIKLTDDTVYNVKNIFLDDYSNIVFLRIDAENLSTISLANSDDARSGKRLISIARSRSNDNALFALGGFFGWDYSNSISTPVSDFLQGVLMLDFSQDVLQRSVGSPVVDFQGNMVGIVASNDLQNTKNIKNFYAIASNDVSNAFETFLQHQSNAVVKNVSLGIDYKMIDVFDAYINNHEITSGAIILSPQTYVAQSKFAQTLAARSGLRGDDIIIMINNEKIDNKNNLSRLIHKHKIDDKIILEVLRAGEPMSINIKIGE